MLVQAEVGDQLLQLAVLVLELLQPSQLPGAKPAVKLLPAVKRLLRNPHPTDHFRHRRPGLRLLQREGDLLFGVPALLHGSAPPIRGLQNRKTLIHAGGENREDVTRLASSFKISSYLSSIC